MMYEIVEAPKLRPHCHGLLESGNVVERGGGNWENGIQFSPVGCYPVTGVEADCPPIAFEDPTDALSECMPVVTFRPYVLTVGLNWNAVDGADPVQIAKDTLEAGSSAKLEYFLVSGSSEGAGPRNPLLADATSVSASDPREAIGALEAAMLDAPTGGAGTLYMSPAAAIQAADALDEKDGKLYTKTTCSLVIVGNFPEQNVYGHVGDIDIYLGDIFIPETRDEYRSNEHVVMAERLAIAAYNSCAAFRWVD